MFNKIKLLYSTIKLLNNTIKLFNIVQLLYNAVKLLHNTIKLLHNTIQLLHYSIKLLHNIMKFNDHSFLYVLVNIYILLLIYLFPGILYNASDQAVFCPDYPPDARQSVMLPSSFGLPSENLRLYAADGTRLHAVFVGQPDMVVRRQAVTLLYLHGNAGNMGHR